MTTPVVVPGVLKIVVDGTTPVYPWANVFHAQYTGGPPSLTTLQNFANNILSEFQLNFGPFAPAPTIINRCTVTDLGSAAHNSEEFISPVNGTNPHDKLPGNVALLITKGSLLGGRGGKPRTYLYIGGDGDLADTGHWMAGFVANVQTAYGNFNTFLGTASIGGVNLTDECVVSTFLDGIKRPVPVPFAISKFAAQPEIASQRRRIGR